jgi:large subunit ribosomal protein L4|uniref:Large ribosomal subunit protein uL4 n=1 Tax=Mesoaciditoga lauensis TaxID=1495039 RepID=A0A7V3RET1_9BACT
MAEIKVMNLEGKEVEKISLVPEIFEVEPSKDLLFRYIHKQLADARSGTASTKVRGEVSGGGRKPWAQKHTGRARAGSIRSPLWRHGAVVFGPRPRDWSEDMNKKMKAGAIKSALSEKLKEGKIIVIDKFEMDAPKIKEFSNSLKTLVPSMNAFCVLDTKSEKQINVKLSSRNLKETKVIIADNPNKGKVNVDGLNVYDMIKFDWLILTKRTVEKITEVYGHGN